MRFCERVNYIKPKTLKDCYRIVGNKAYFQESHDYIYYCTYEDLSVLRRMQLDRIKENMKSGQVDDWECCDNKGLFSFFKMARIKYSRASKFERETMLLTKEMIQKDEDELEPWEVAWMDNLDNFEKIKVAQFLNEDENGKNKDNISDEEFWMVVNNADKLIAELKNK